MAAQWKIGDRIENRWEIYKIHGGFRKSGMGIVYVVYDHKFGEVSAAKTFQEEAFAKNPAIAERFVHEAHAWINLDIHENVTRARSVEPIQGKPFLFLEYVSGGDLGEWIGTPQLTQNFPQVLRLAIQFCDGMIHALGRGIKAHRDIKPENCLITEDRTLKVTDFGLAKVFDDSSVDDSKAEAPHEEERLGVVLSRTGIGAGTRTHMAPEQFDDAKHVDVRADIYSFGVMLFQMLTGQLPFRAGPDWQEWKRLHKAAPTPVLDGRLAAVNAVLQGCLAKAPAQRFADFGAVRERLAEIYEKLTGRAPAPPASGAELNAADWYNKARSLVKLERAGEALACCDRALELNPRLVPAWDFKAQALVELKRPEEALACYDRALELNPGSEVAWNNKGRVLIKLGRPKEALALYDRVLEHSPDSEQAWSNKGWVLNNLGRPNEALACYDRALELNPRFEQAWINKAVLLGDLGRPDDELSCYDRTLELNPRSEVAWNNKGRVLIKLGRREEALTLYDRVLEIYPRSYQAWNNWNIKAMLLAGLGRPTEALTCYERSLELNPLSELTWTSKGIRLQALNRREEVLTCYDRVLEINPRSELAWNNKAILLDGLGRPNDALACYDRALELNPRNDAAWNNKGMLLSGLGRPGESLSCCDRALELNPRHQAAWYSKALALVNLARLKEAVAAFEQAQSHGHPRAAGAIQVLRQAMAGSGSSEPPAGAGGTRAKT